jgi:peptidoglycan hydrolase CwlO-like protein
MVFFTAIAVAAVIYFMQAEGFIYATIIALVMELLNMTMTHSLTKSVEKKVTKKYMNVIEKYKKKLAQLQKRKLILQGQHDDDTNALYEARIKMKEYASTIEEYDKKIEELENKIKEQEDTIARLQDLPGASKKE